MKKKIKALLLLGLVFLGGCGQASAPSVSSAGTDSQSIDLFAMDTAMTLTAYGDHAGEALEAAKSEIERLDALFSISSESGDIYALNHDHTVALHEDTRALLSRALEVSASTGGIFDCTIEPVMQAWGFTTQQYRVPDPAELSTLLAHVDYTQVQLDGSTAAIPDDVQVDLGGIAKGYTSDRMMQIFSENGVTSGIISLGGNVQALGLKSTAAAGASRCKTQRTARKTSPSLRLRTRPSSPRAAISVILRRTARPITTSSIHAPAIRPTAASSPRPSSAMTAHSRTVSRPRCSSWVWTMRWITGARIRTSLMRF